MKRIVVLIVSLILVGVMITSCTTSTPTPTGTPTSTPTPTPTAKTFTLGLVLSTLNNPFFVTLRDGAQAEATKQGVTLIVMDSQNDSAKEATNIEDLISRKVDAILVLSLIHIS